MEWDQALFRWVYRGTRRFMTLPFRRNEPPQGLAFEAVKERLTPLAGCLAGEARTLVSSADAGGPHGEYIALPAHGPDLDAELGMTFFLFRTAYAVTSQRLGFLAPASVAQSEQALAALLAVPVTLGALDKELPGLALARQRLFSELSRQQQKTAPLSEQDLVLYALSQRVLNSQIIEQMPAAVQEYLAFVDQHPVHGPKDLHPQSQNFCAFRKLGHRPKRDGVTFGVVLRAFGFLDTNRMMNAKRPLPPMDDSATPASREITERTAPVPVASSTEIEVVEFDEDKQADNPVVHSFEKLHTADEYQGGRKAIDDEDELALHQEALEEVNLRKVVRTVSQARSVYRMDAMLSPALVDLEDKTRSMPTYRYDEWDFQSRSYRKDYCDLYLEAVPPAPPGATDDSAFSPQQVAAVRRAMERLDLARRFERRQIDGSECDIDALVDRHADLKSGHTPTDKCYIDRRRIERELAVLILIDTSFSSDAWIDNRRVIDITKDAVGLVGHAAERIGEHFSLAAFHSHSRRDCRFTPLKAFSEPWHLAQSRLALVQPAGYTRIGPAMRHATQVLSASTARRNLLLLFTDAKPTDYDRYEGQYGIEDVRRAVEEATEAGIHCFTVAIGKSGQAHLPRMFGREYRAVVHPLQLAQTMAELYARLGR